MRKRLLFLFLSVFFIFACYGMDNAAFDKLNTKVLREIGLIEPSREEVLIKRLQCAALISLPVLILLVFWAAKKWQKRQNEKDEEKRENAAIEDNARVIALDELESGQTDRLAFAKAVEESNGNAALAKSLYIKIRVEQILKQKQEAKKQHAV